MIDARQEWAPLPDWTSATATSGTLAVRTVQSPHQTVVSGNVEAALAAAGVEEARVGLWDIAGKFSYAVSVARDKSVIVSDAPIAIGEGWSADGWAAIQADDATLIIELEGNGLDDLLAELSVTVIPRSASAAVIFAGIRLLVYRVAETTARIHVAAGFAPFLWEWLTTREAYS